MSREQRLARVFVELADTLVAEFDVIDFLHTLTDRSVELLGADAAGSDARRPARQPAADRVLGRVGAAAGGLRAAERRRPVPGLLPQRRAARQSRRCDDAARWPSFWAETNQLGFRSAHALPMRLREQVIGAINLFGTTADSRSAPTMSLSGRRWPTSRRSDCCRNARCCSREVLVEQLQTALNSRVLIEQAKGVLAERRRCSNRRGLRPDARPCASEGHHPDQGRDGHRQRLPHHRGAVAQPLPPLWQHAGTQAPGSG